MNIPYNKKSIKNCKIVKDIIPLNIYGIKKAKIETYNTVRNRKKSFLDIYKNIDNDRSKNLNLLICIKELIIKVVF